MYFINIFYIFCNFKVSHDNLESRDPDINSIFAEEEQDIFQCKYYDLDKFNSHSKSFHKNSLSIICFNIRSFTKNSDEFLGYLHNVENKFDVIVLTETWGNEEILVLFNIPGYNSYHNYRQNKQSGGVSIFVKNTLHSEEIVSLNISNDVIESATVNITLPVTGKIIKIMGIYRPPNGDTNDFIETLENTINEYDLSSSDSIITGDFNICLLKEQYSLTTQNLINLMRSYNFRPLITRPTRIDRNDTLTLIDHMWTNCLNTSYAGIFLADITDHLPIYCSLQSLIQERDNNQLLKIQFRDLSNRNKQNFTIKLTEVDWNELLDDISDVNAQTKKYMDCIDKIYNDCFPVKSKILGTKRLSSPWITNALLKSIQNKHRLYKRVKMNDYDMQRYNQYSNMLKQLIRNSKSKYYKEKFDSHMNDVRQTWNVLNSVIKPGKKKSSIVKLIKNNRLTSEPNEVAEILNEHFSGIGIKLADALPPINNNVFRKYLPPPTLNSIYLTPCTPFEVHKLINSLKNKKGNINSPSTAIIKQNSSILSLPISLLFNKIVIRGIYPDILKIACVTGIYKGGDKCDPNNYRPISSLPLLNKVFEKLLHKRLISFLETNKILSDRQYGFRKNRNTCHAVNELTSHIYKAFNEKKYTGAVFLDLSKAFDTVPHDILLSKLSNYGIRNNALSLLESYLNQRKQFVVVNDIKSTTKHITIGVPQGSVLGPLLFLIFINDLPLATKRIKSILFADDTTLFYSHENIQYLKDSLNADLTRVKDWLLANRLTLNLKKTYFILFSLKPIPDNIRIEIGSYAIDRKPSGKFLGVILDGDLSFKEHVSSICSKISKTVGLMYKVKHYFPNHVLKNLYFSLIYHYLTYCIQAWGNTYETVLNPLQLLQKKVIRILTNSEFHAHTSPLFKALGILKLNDIYALQVLLLMKKTITLKEPTNLLKDISEQQPIHNYPSRNKKLRTPFCRIEKCKNMLSYQCVNHWNKIPVAIKEKNNLVTFKNEYIKFVINHY